MNEEGDAKQKKKATPKVMKLIDPRTGEMECRVCGAHHWANIRPQSGGLYYRGSWQCVNGCKLDENSGGQDADAR
jgi:hypothetical protein